MCPLPFGPVFSGHHASKALPNWHYQVVQSACARRFNKLGEGGGAQVATVASAADMAPQLRRCFSHEVAVEAPDQGQRRMLLEALLGEGARALSPAALDNAAAQSAGEGPPTEKDSGSITDHWWRIDGG